MSEYYDTLMKQGEVDIPTECIMTFMMYCFLTGLLGHSLASGYVSKTTKRFYLV